MPIITAPRAATAGTMPPIDALLPEPDLLEELLEGAEPDADPLELPLAPLPVADWAVAVTTEPVAEPTAAWYHVPDVAVVMRVWVVLDEVSM